MVLSHHIKGIKIHMFNSTPGMDYNKKKRPIPRKLIIITVFIVSILLAGGATYFLINNSTPQTNVATDSDSSSETADVSLPLSVDTKDTGAKVNYPNGWQADLSTKENFSDTVTLSNDEIDAQLVIEFAMARQSSDEASAPKESELIAIYQAIVNQKAEDLGGTVEKKQKTTFDFADSRNTWYSQRIAYTEGGTDFYNLHVYPLSGTSTVTINATFRADDAPLISTIINAIELDNE